jgi:lipopolysaccharide exporter
MLTLKTIFGAGWSIMSRLSGRLIDFATVLVLARILTPADFGLVALASTIVSVLDTIFEVPLMQALVRLRTIERAHLDTAFTIGVARGVVLGSLVAGAAVPFSWLYSDARLINIVLVMSLAPVLRSLSSPKMSDYYRTLNFHKIFAIEVSGKISGAAIAIAVVLAGGSYWAIVFNSVASALITTVLSYSIARYHPRASLSRLSDFSGFIGWFSAGQILSAVNWQLDRVLLGHFLTKTTFGQYTMSSDISVLPTQAVIGPSMQPVMAAFSSMNQDTGRLQLAFLKATRFAILLALPSCIGISMCADLIVQILLGPKWLEAVFFLRWLALPIGLTAYFQAVYTLAVAVDRFSLIVRLNLIDVIVRTTLLAAGFFTFGITGVLIARGVTAFIMFVLSMRAAKSMLKLAVRDQLQNIWQIAAACVVMAGSITAFRHWPGPASFGYIIEFALVSSLGVMIYMCALYTFGIRVGSLISLPARASEIK